MTYRKKPILISKNELDAIVTRLGEDISRDYKDSSLVIVIILKGAFIFASDLIRKIKVKDMKVDFVRVSSYGVGQRESTGTVKLWKDISVNVCNKDVLIVEDIIDSGTTLHFLVNRIKASHAKSVKLCTLLDKFSKRIAPIQPDYNGKIIEDKYVFGYGLDLDEMCRNYPDIHFEP